MLDLRGSDQQRNSTDLVEAAGDAWILEVSSSSFQISQPIMYERCLAIVGDSRQYVKLIHATLINGKSLSTRGAFS